MVIDRELAGVPHHLGFRSRVIACGVTVPSMNGPPDRSTAGSTVVQAGLQPTFSITCAGTRLAKSSRQSANGVLNLTVTVRPPLEPVTDVMSR